MAQPNHRPREHVQVNGRTTNGLVTLPAYAESRDGIHWTKPMLGQYVRRIQRRAREQGFDGRLMLMTSSGLPLPVEQCVESPVRLIESGPAAGVLAARGVAPSFCGFVAASTTTLCGASGGFTTVLGGCGAAASGGGGANASAGGGALGGAFCIGALPITV